MSIKITFTKELTIDLNAYYPTLSRKLRAEIDAEVLALVTGDRQARPKGNGASHGDRGLIWSEVGDEYRLTDPLRECRINGEKVPRGGKALIEYRAIQRKFGGQAFLMDDAVKFVKHEFPDVQPSTIITNMWRFGFMHVERLQK